MRKIPDEKKNFKKANMTKILNQKMNMKNPNMTNILNLRKKIVKKCIKRTKKVEIRLKSFVSK